MVIRKIGTCIDKQKALLIYTLQANVREQIEMDKCNFRQKTEITAESYNLKSISSGD